MVRYQSFVADNARWEGFAFRRGDIVISTPPKSGTTWTQMLCALLIFDGPEFPAPLEQLSPWMDMLIRPTEAAHAILDAQQHRRFIKTHTPLDGLPLRDDVTYLVVGRDPRDVAISMEHHQANVQVERFLELRATAVAAEEANELPEGLPPIEDPVERFRAFVENDHPVHPLNLANVLHHLDTAWQRRADPNVAMFHYADYQADLPGEMLRLASVLGIPLDATRAEELAAEAGIERMRERADEVVPDASQGPWKSTRAFLRSGASGEWRARVSEADVVRYRERVASLVTDDLAAWAHGGRLGSGVDPQQSQGAAGGLPAGGRGRRRPGW